MMKINKKSKEGIKKKIASFSLLALLFNAAMVGVFAPSGDVLRAYGPTYDDAVAICNAYEAGGKTVVMFSEGIRSDKTQVEAQAGPVSTSILAGAYDVTLVSYDGYSTRSSTNPAGQSQEEWYAILKNGGGMIIKQTNAIGDLKDCVNYVIKEETVNTGLIISEDITSVIAHHNAYPTGASGANSVYPVCAVFDLIPPEPEEVTIIASKIICDEEADLPNWGAGGLDITENTATNYVAQHPGCSLEEGWSFQVGENKNDNRPIKYPGDHYGEAAPGDGWTTFGPTGLDGKTQTTVIITEDTEQLRLREVLKNGYIPFTYDNVTEDNSNNVSAEFYCHKDVYKYDNYDYIRNTELVAGGTYYCVAFNTLIEPIYGPYCGDGEVNQEWEQCDSGNDPQIVGCSEQCQYITGECSEKVFARAVVTDVQNKQETEGMTDHVFLGTDTLPIPSGAWFMVYDGLSYINDPDINGYENVPGLAVQRDNGSITVRHYGSHSNECIQKQEHVEGYLEFYNAGTLDIANDTSGNNQMENWGPDMYDQRAVNAGKDAAWIIDGNKSHFWMTVTTADDSYFTTYVLPPVCEEEPICSVFGYKYNYDTELGLIDWIIGLAQIIDCAADEEWADSVVSYSPEGVIVPERTDPSQSLGIAEDNDTINFVSLGMNGELVLEFNNLILNEVGDDIEVVETSFGDPTCQEYPEKINVFASQNGTDWEDLGEGCLDSTFDLGSLPWAKFVKLLDVSDQQGDGYDVDGVRALHCGNYEAVTSTTTDVSGAYCFTDVSAGNYAVYEEMKDGWSIWDVLLGGQSVINYFIDSFFDVFIEIEVEDGETTQVDFLNQEDVPETNEPPVADAGADQTVIVGTIVDFDGSASYDTDGTIVSYDWNFDDGDTGTGATTTHIYTATGTYSAVLTVTDDDSATGTDTVQIIVEDGDNPVNRGDVIINEIMWADISDKSDDQWIELKNVFNSPVNLKGCELKFYKGSTENENKIAYLPDDIDIILNSGAYYLVSHYTEGTSHIGIDPDFGGTSKVNNFTYDQFQIKLYCPDATGVLIEIDEVGDAVNPPAFGDDGDPKKSMQWCGSAWEDALVGGVANNWDTGATEFGTPGLPNVCEEEPDLGSLTICKQEDLNGDGILDNGEPVVTDPLWSFSIGVVEYQAGENGCITIENLPYGEYNVIEGTVEGWESTSLSGESTGNGVFETDGSITVIIGESNSVPIIYFLNQRVEPVYQCSDGDDNDGDGYTDKDDPGCWETPGDPESYDPDDDDENNCGDGRCDTNFGETCHTCTADCGSCGGGGGGGGGTVITKLTIIITNEDVVYLGNGEALVTWTTNIETTQQVAYGDDSVTVLGAVPEYGYDSVNGESTGMTKEHSVTIGGLVDGVVYYFRPIADRSGSTGERVGIEVSYELGEVEGIEAPEPVECNYLLEYIKLGADNNPVEVEKLERFLNEFEGENLAVNGIYEQVDFDAVSRFQEKYFDQVLSPWNHDSSTGYVYITTKKRINELYCEREFPLTSEQESEVSAFSERFLGTPAIGGEAPDFTGDSEELVTEDMEEGKVGGVETEEGEELVGMEGEEDEHPEEIKIDLEDGDEDEDAATAYSDYSRYILIILALIILALAYRFYNSRKTKQGEDVQ